jgi:hypothetical protein
MWGFTMANWLSYMTGSQGIGWTSSVLWDSSFAQLSTTANSFILFWFCSLSDLKRNDAKYWVWLVWKSWLSGQVWLIWVSVLVGDCALVFCVFFLSLPLFLFGLDLFIYFLNNFNLKFSFWQFSFLLVFLSFLFQVLLSSQQHHGRVFPVTARLMTATQYLSVTNESDLHQVPQTIKCQFDHDEQSINILYINRNTKWLIIWIILQNEMIVSSTVCLIF